MMNALTFVVLGGLLLGSGDDVSQTPSMETLKAESAYVQARLDRVQAELRLAEHEAAYPTKVRLLNEQIDKAAAALIKADQNQQARITQDRENVSARLALQRASIELSNEQKKLYVFKNYSHPKTRDELSEAAESARAEEVRLREAYDRAVGLTRP